MSLDYHNPQIKLIYDTAIKLLARREYAKKELALKIQLKLHAENINEQLINTVINELITKNYQSDLRYAQMLCQTRVNQKYGSKRISYELSQHDIADEIIRNVLSEYEDIWLENAKQLIIKKTINKFNNEVLAIQPDKLKSYLLQKGYDFPVINSAINNYLSLTKK